MSSSFLSTWPRLADTLHTLPSRAPAESASARALVDRMTEELKGPLQAVAESLRKEWGATSLRSRSVGLVEIDLAACMSQLQDDLGTSSRSSSSMRCANMLRLAGQVSQHGAQLFAAISSAHARSVEPAADNPFVDVPLADQPLLGRMQQVRPRCLPSGCTLL